ncbi:IS5 family transposase [Planctomycetales bacterium]|nr:IS5 family transposase [Planctomycetales bacterium]
MNRRTLLIYCVHQDQGRVHDFKLYRQTILKLLLVGVMFYADSGYQGIAKVHANSVLAIKKKKHKKLSEKDKRFNYELSSKWVAVKHVNAKIKTFKIMAYPYRNRRRRHLLRTTLICGIINAETQT